MPTLLIVQVGLGGIKHNIKAPTTLSIFQVGTRPSSVVLDTLAATMLRDDGSRRIMPPSVHDEDTEAAPSVLKTSDERPKLSEPLMVEVKTGSDLSWYDGYLINYKSRSGKSYLLTPYFISLLVVVYSKHVYVEYNLCFSRNAWFLAANVHSGNMHLCKSTTSVVAHFAKSRFHFLFWKSAVRWSDFRRHLLQEEYLSFSPTFIHKLSHTLREFESISHFSLVVVVVVTEMGWRWDSVKSKYICISGCISTRSKMWYPAYSGVGTKLVPFV